MIEGDAKLLIQQALIYNSSDIHILPSKSDYQIFYRINGQLVPQTNQPHQWGKKLISHFKFLADMDVGERRRPQSGSCSLELEGESIELRFSTIVNVLLLESLVIRILRVSQSHQTSASMYFPQDTDELSHYIQRKSGLVLFSGPVGSGKTTLIYQLLRERIQNEALQIITMEDPVEIFEERFLQTEVNEKAGISYDLLIKSSLRHHPDILMIGEIRDEETARMAVRAALTGHLMVATVHAKDTRGVIARLQELGLTDEQLRQTLICVCSQRLIPYRCALCKENCHSLCHRNQRLTLLEILANSDLKAILANHTLEQHTTLNDKLRKAWAYGYIDTTTYHRFEII